MTSFATLNLLRTTLIAASGRALTALGAVALCGWSAFADSEADNELARVRQRVLELQPTAEERRLDEIGWANDLREALRLARRHDRPVFLFTHDGRMAIGRC